MSVHLDVTKCFSIPAAATRSSERRTAEPAKLPSPGLCGATEAAAATEPEVSSSCTSNRPTHPEIDPEETGQSYQSRARQSQALRARIGFLGRAAQTRRRRQQLGSNNNNNSRNRHSSSTRDTTARPSGRTTAGRVGREHLETTPGGAARRSSTRRHSRDAFITPTVSTATR